MPIPSNGTQIVLLYEPHESRAQYVADVLERQHIRTHTYKSTEAFLCACKHYNEAACIIGGAQEALSVLDTLLQANVLPQRILYNALGCDQVPATQVGERSFYRGVRVGNSRAPQRATIDQLIAQIQRAA